MNKILDGAKLANEIKLNLKEKIQKLTKVPHLAVIKIGNDPASEIYIKNKEKQCANIGINFTKVELSQNISNDEVIEQIQKLNQDENITGILLQLPIPKDLNERLLIDTLDPNKDIDGLTTTNMGKLYSNNCGYIPCTPKGIIRLLKHYNIPIAEKNVVIVGRSNLVGKPLISLFLQENATVTICHSKTKGLEEYTKKADILVVAIGKKQLITADMVKDNACIVDVGINRDNNKIYGDVDFENVINKVQYITPVPGGVGPMTIAMLLENITESQIS